MHRERKQLIKIKIKIKRKRNKEKKNCRYSQGVKNLVDGDGTYCSNIASSNAQGKNLTDNDGRQIGDPRFYEKLKRIKVLQRHLSRRKALKS